MQRKNLVKKSFRLSGHATSVALEPVFWQVLGEIAGARGMTLSRLVSELDKETPPNLASALRVQVVNHLKKQIS